MPETWGLTFLVVHLCRIRSQEFRGTIAPVAQRHDRRDQYDVAVDGQRFLVHTPPQDASVPITVVLNWTAALKK
jgi:hypothetical protein